MQCATPPPLTDDQISAILDGAAEPAAQAHLARCESCAQRLVKARQMEQSLRARMRRWDCPPPQQLADYAIGRAAPDAARAIAAHLAGCVRCTAELSDLQEFMAAEPPIAAPPPAPMPPRQSPWGALFARPAQPRPAVALRGAGAGPIVATAGGTTIFIDTQPAGAGQVALQGQLVDADQDRWAGALVEIRQAGALVATAEVDQLGSFAPAPIAPGGTELRIIPAIGRMIVLAELDLKL